MVASHRAVGGFALTKWYLDTVAADGTAAIVYWTALRAFGVTLRWQQLAWYAPGEPVCEASAHSRAASPSAAAHRVDVRIPALALDAAYEVRASADALTLLDSDAGGVAWQCVATAAAARMRCGAKELRGAGYVERLRLTLPPWHLPIDALTWGRWISDDLAHSLVWIDWQGAAPRRWVLVDGVCAAEAALSAHGVATAQGTLALAEPRLLHERSVGTLVRTIRGLALLSRRIPLSWHETKWLARAQWSAGDKPEVAGWAIHETVQLR